MRKRASDNNLRCPTCKSTEVVQGGHTDNGRRRRYKCKNCGKRTTKPLGWEHIEGSEQFEPLDTSAYAHTIQVDLKTRKVKRFVITSAQNASPIHRPFFRTLERYCAHNRAALIVIPYRYHNPTSLFTKKDKFGEIWAPEITPFLMQDQIELNGNLVILGDIKTQPTATSPTSGLETITGSKSAIIGHPKLELITIPTPQKKFPKIVMTTGSITKHNYTDSRAGKKGEYHHTFGALVVEIEGDRFYIRQLNALRDGSFIDLDKTYTPTGVQGKTQALALVMGDSHVSVIDPTVIRATFTDPGSMIKTLKPKYLVWHDVLDFQTRNHHTRDNVFVNYAQHQAHAANVEEEINRTLEFIDKHSPAYCTNIIVPSNHNEAFERWVRECDPKTDPENLMFWAKTFVMMLNETHFDQYRTHIPDPFAQWAKHKLKCINRTQFLERDESFSVRGVELGFHGDQGANGARGTITTFGKIGTKSIIGHCLTSGHDVQTKSNGWVPISEVCIGEEVLSFDATHAKNIWVKVIDTQHFKFTGRLLHLRHRGAFEQEVTEAHNLFLRNGDYLPVCQAVMTRNASELPIFATSDGGGTLSLPESTIRKIVAVCADGSFYHRSLGFHIKKLRKRQRLSWLFGDDLRAWKPASFGSFRASLKMSSLSYQELIQYINPDDKRLPALLYNLDERGRLVFIDELSYWDGTFKNNSRSISNQFGTSKEDEANMVSSLLCRQGYRVTCEKQDSRGAITITWSDKLLRPDLHPVTTASWDKARMAAWGMSTQPVENKDTYCLSVGTRCFWVRHQKSGLVSLTGNSHVPGIKNGVYQVGTSSSLQLFYNEGPSGWLHCHCVLYPNGKRSLLIMIDGNWRFS